MNQCSWHQYSMFIAVLLVVPVAFVMHIYPTSLQSSGIEPSPTASESKRLEIPAESRDRNPQAEMMAALLEKRVKKKNDNVIDANDPAANPEGATYSDLTVMGHMH
eukprot:gnl/MRDRNA2_/MRDRNA2_234167_c0_seq1.p2 gnl/MRDRNA2_/MRDRNA2_234167_c0~~gnl/MRDRNA2_/MRDRNA2_234167_c0_seq1.p2  ORF type:complete len:106 (-),score=24.49 gnl/MRDRNA2_/MRDRNA2_234167_c0_seq1:219-536(-)